MANSKAKIKTLQLLSKLMMRKSGEWMAGIDDRILEYLYENKPSRPSDIARDDYIYCSPSYIGQRLRELRDYDLVAVQEEPIYEITDKGSAYLIGAYDAENEKYLHNVKPERGAKNYQWIELKLNDYAQEAKNLFEEFK